MDPIVVNLRADPAHRITKAQAEIATSDLRDALSDVAASVTHGVAPAKVGAKSPEVALVGTLLVTLLGQTAEVEHLVDAIRRWLRQTPRFRVSVKVNGREIEVETSSQEDISRLIKFYIDHPRSP